MSSRPFLLSAALPKRADNRGAPHLQPQLALVDWWLLAGFLVLAAPVLRALWIGSWSTAQGAQGPIVLVSGLWLLLQTPEQKMPAPAQAARTDAAAYAALAVLLSAYAIALATGFAAFAWVLLVAVATVVLFLIRGWSAVSARWFAFAYLLFAAPVPTRFAAGFVDALSIWLSTRSVDILWMAGIDAAHSGLDLYVDQYELRMADACAGLNSLNSLFAVGMFYVYVRHRGHWLHAFALCLLVPPIAILANLMRILVLLMITHVWGDRMAQGMVHAGAGMFMFVFALVVLLGLDAALSGFRTHASYSA